MALLLLEAPELEFWLRFKEESDMSEIWDLGKRIWKSWRKKKELEEKMRKQQKERKDTRENKEGQVKAKGPELH